MTALDVSEDVTPREPGPPSKGLLPLPSRFGQEYLSLEELSLTASRKDGIDEETEISLRIFGCELIQESGILLKLPMFTIASAQVNFHRFYHSESFKMHDVWHIAMGSVFVSCKAEETIRKKLDVLNVFEHIFQQRNGLDAAPIDVNSNVYRHARTALLNAEKTILRVLGFVINMGHPHKFTLQYLQDIFRHSHLDEKEKALAQKAWNYTQDSFRTTSCLVFPPEIVAAAAVFLASRDEGLELPPNWESVWNIDPEDKDIIAGLIEGLYSRPKALYLPVCESAAKFYQKRKDDKIAEDRKQEEIRVAKKAAHAAAKKAREEESDVDSMGRIRRPGGSKKRSSGSSSDASSMSSGAGDSARSSPRPRSASSSPAGSPENRGSPRPTTPPSKSKSSSPAPASPADAASGSASPKEMRARSRSRSRSEGEVMPPPRPSLRKKTPSPSRGRRRSNKSRGKSGSQSGHSSRRRSGKSHHRKDHRRPSRSRSRERDGRGERDRGDRGGDRRNRR